MPPLGDIRFGAKLYALIYMLPEMKRQLYALQKVRGITLAQLGRDIFEFYLAHGVTESERATISNHQESEQEAIPIHEA